jgi:hypothetical protein
MISGVSSSLGPGRSSGGDFLRITSGAEYSFAENTSDVTIFTATAAGGTTPYVYAIASGDDAALFTINASTGAVSKLDDADYEAPDDDDEDGVYEIRVSVTDADDTTVMKSVSLELTDDADELAPGYEYQTIPRGFVGIITVSMGTNGDLSPGGDAEINALSGTPSAATVQSLLEAIAGSGNVEVADDGDVYLVKFVGTLAQINIDQMTVASDDLYAPNDGSGTTPSKTNQSDWADPDQYAKVEVQAGSGAIGWMTYAANELSGGSVTFANVATQEQIKSILEGAGYPTVTVIRTGNSIEITHQTTNVSFDPVTIGGRTGAFDEPAIVTLQDGAEELPSDHSILTGLVSYWKLDEASGSRADAHGSSNLTDNNTVGSAAGKIGNGALFVAANSEYLSGGPSIDLASDFTLWGWVQKDDGGLSGSAYFGTEGGVFLAQSTATGNPTLVFIEVMAFTSSAMTLNAGPYDITALSLLVIQWEAATKTATAYWNNASGGSSSGSGTLPAASPLTLGKHHGGAYGNGLLDEVGFSARLLTSDERAAIYNAGAGSTYPDFA